MIKQMAQDRSPRVRQILWAAAGMLLLIPLTAMQFTDEVRWTASDFVAAGVLIVAAGGGLELIARRSESGIAKATAALALITIVALVWINGAVGIVGQEGSPLGWLVIGVASLVLGCAVLLVARTSR